MAGKPDDNPNSLSSTLESAKRAAEQGFADVQKQADAVMKEAASHLVAGGAMVAEFVRQGMSVADQYAEQGKGYINYGLGETRKAEDAVIAEIKHALQFVQSNPYVSYPLLATGSLLLLPGTRRLLYRATLGRLRSADAILQSSEGKVEGLRVKMSDYASEARKLQERMAAAEEEYLSGRAKLKATRQELQRLAAVVAKSERAAAGVLEDLRAIRKVDKAVQLRAEAASQASSLRSQRSTLLQNIYRIASRDI